MAGFLVFFMAAGFAMLEGGLVRSKNVAMQMIKNVALFSFAAIMYWLIGFNLMYPGDGWTIAGWLGPFLSTTSLDPAGVAPTDAALDYASIGSDFFLSTGVRCRDRLNRVGRCGRAYQVVALPDLRHRTDRHTVPHLGLLAVGWWLAIRKPVSLTSRVQPLFTRSVAGRLWRGAIILGPRIGKYKDGKVHPIPGSNLALATLGTLHPMAGLVWLQRRLAIGNGHRG